MPTADNLLYSALHGTAWRYAIEQRNLAESIAELRQLAGGRNDILAQAAGITVGTWGASPATHVGHELVVAGGPLPAVGLVVIAPGVSLWSPRALSCSGDHHAVHGVRN